MSRLLVFCLRVLMLVWSIKVWRSSIR
uniref:Uncharacterized protein n=1 Tax=Arundo donax TaxID=35708 RepID=A0A0A9ABU9_ARUDO